jgi:serine/threonine protein kinase
MIETGKILQERYRVDRQIGQGGMGAVYIATDERFGSMVAIKETLCMDDNYRRAIEREARLLNSLKHNALPRVTDHFLEENGQFLVMEYIPGEDLCCILDEREEPFPPEQVLNWADQLLEALEFLHNQENPVIHRDIKPQNLKITPKGQIILLDFGLAKGNVTGAGNQTNAKSIFGYSRNYASLEQIQGTGTDPRSDLYSLAATLYHLLTKLPPEDALTRAMSVLSKKPDPLIPVNQVRPEVPAGVAAILHKALDLDAAERPESAVAMRGMLRNHEDFRDLAFSTVSIARAGNARADIHGQKTELMPGATFHDANRATQAKTEVLPNHASQVTAIRPLAQNRETGGFVAGSTDGSVDGKRKRRFAAAAIAGGLLLAGSVLAGVYAYSPTLFGATETNVPATEPEKLAAPVTESATSSTESVLSDAGASTSANTEPSVGKSEPETGTKKSDTAKTAKPDSKTKSKSSDDDENVIIDGDNVDVGDIKIRNGRVIMPDGRVFDQNQTGNIPKPPPVNPYPNVDPRDLTPQQRRRLRMLQRRYPGPVRVPSPKPY